MILTNTLIEEILENYKRIIGEDFLVYRNHIYRIYNICLKLDNNTKNHEKYAIAAVFHDLGIWTHNFDYLEPSKILATKYLEGDNKENALEISLLINNHHKISSYKGDFETTTNIFRKADWIDVTNRLKRFGFSKKEFKIIKKEFPNNGFHLFLVKQWFRWFLKHPFNSLPMFKK